MYGWLCLTELSSEGSTIKDIRTYICCIKCYVWKFCRDVIYRLQPPLWGPCMAGQATDGECVTVHDTSLLNTRVVVEGLAQPWGWGAAM